MAQYRYFHEGQLKVDPTTGTRCRTGQLNHQFVKQKFVGGVWTGIGDSDGVRYGDVAGAGCRFREGMKGGDYVVDVELEIAGFLLAENDGWVNCGSVSGYWMPEKQLAGESVNFWAKGRNGLTMPDVVGGNDVSILTPTFKGNGSSSVISNPIGGLVTPENIFDGTDHTIYFKIKQLVNRSATSYFFRMGNNSSAMCGLSLIDEGGNLDYYLSDGTNVHGIVFVAGVDANFKSAGWIECFIQITAGVTVVITLYKKSDGTVIATNTKNISTWNVANNNTDFRLSLMSNICAWTDLKKFTGIKTLAQCRDNSYTTGLQFFYPSCLDGTDVSGNAYHMSLIDCSDNNKYYDSILTYHLDKGYSIYSGWNISTGALLRDIYVPNDINGNPIVRTSDNLIYNAIGLNSVYTSTIQEDGSLTNHNLSDSLLVIPLWDRSDITKFNAACRASSFYDVLNPTRWHISELNQITIIGYTNTNYQGEEFIKVTENSYDARHLLIELFSFVTNKIGNDLTNALRYTGDAYIPNIIYLANPYINVLKITANADSEFKFNVNNSIVYSRQEIYNKIDAVIKLNPGEDKITTIFRWLKTNVDIYKNLSQYDTAEGNLIQRFNSYARSQCGGLATTVYEILDHYYSNDSFVSCLPAHITNYNSNVYMDIGYNYIFYKGKYITANINEIIADEKLILEALKRTSFTLADHAVYLAIVAYFNGASYQQKSTVDNLTMKLLENSTFIFPVKSVNAPKDYLGHSMTQYANGIMDIPSTKIGVISMPFTLLQVTGTGTIKIDNITYNLATDQAALLGLFRNPSKYYNAFEILTNTGGVQAEYLIEQRRLLLWKYNRISLGVVSGAILCESIVTATPIGLTTLAINKKSAESWSLTFDEEKKMSGVFKIPVSENGMSHYTVTFKELEGKIPLPVLISNCVVVGGGANTGLRVEAGVAVIDQCFAARLDPRNDTFSGSLELTFTTYDGSNCYYTLDGSTPDSTKTLYTVPFTITATTTVKWINIKTDYADSHVNTRIITKV